MYGFTKHNISYFVTLFHAYLSEEVHCTRSDLLAVLDALPGVVLVLKAAQHELIVLGLALLA